MFLLLIFASVAIVASFLCSLWEAVLLSITPSYAQLKRKENSVTGNLIDKYKQDIDQPLAAILTLNTIAHTVGAIGVGNQAGKIWGEASPVITGIIIPIVMTLGILILSEIIPKTIGATYWQKLAPITVKSLAFIIMCLYPLIWFCQLITKVLKTNKSQSIFNPSEFVAMAEIGVKEGKLNQLNSNVLKNLLKFDVITVKNIMTPRTVIRMAEENKLISVFYESFKELPFSRIPVHKKGAPDHITGYILKSDLFSHVADGKSDDELALLKRDILVNKDTCTLMELFNQLLEKREHISLIVDDFGGVAGIVTMEDIIETILGLEIVDELDKVEDMQALARENWKKRAKSSRLIE